MKKEILFAVFLGLVVGLVITVGMYRARLAVQTAEPEATFQALASPTANIPSQTPGTPTGLSITSPTQEALVHTPSLYISGTTQAEIPVVLLQNDKEFIVFSDSQGNFSTQVTLSAGANVFHIRAMIPNQPPVETIRTVIYAREDLSLPGTATISATTKPTSTPNPKP